jgi:methylenetetrahydrofolate reductase (NADPH)
MRQSGCFPTYNVPGGGHHRSHYPGLKPLTTKKQVDVLPETFSIDIPRELTQAIRQAGDKAEAVRRVGIEWCITQCRDLLAHQVPAIHFYTMGKSQNITDVLRAAF